jgi:hypothetical protein
MYRFRSIRNLLGEFQELERQEIYFASASELNDPMEGLRDIFWTGDAIVWRNLIIHYIKSLERIYFLFQLQGPEQAIDERNLPGMHELMGYPTEAKKKIVEEIISKLFASPYISKLPDAFARRKTPVRRNELTMCLRTIHAQVLSAINEVYAEHSLATPLKTKAGVVELPENSPEIDSSIIDILEQDSMGPSSERFFSLLNILTESMLWSKQSADASVPQMGSVAFMLVDFPGKFVSKLEGEIFPPWYTASFLSECSNSAVWGHYGDNHRGVCLKFRTIAKDGKEHVQLKTECGVNGAGTVFEMRPHQFRPVRYDTKPLPIDFFRFIGRMPKFQLNAMWYKDASGNSSICGEHLAADKEGAWGESYWDNYLKGLCVKLKEWEYEKEYRLIVHGDFVDYSKSADRKLFYDFNSLEAIIFGIKTSREDKLKIVRIIQQKCQLAKRTDFEFYQAYYASDIGAIETIKIDPLK